jgi:hypothetical protein
MAELVAIFAGQGQFLTSPWATWPGHALAMCTASKTFKSLIDMCVGGGALMHLLGGKMAVGDDDVRDALRRHWARGKASFHMSLRTMLRGASLSTVASGTQGRAGT